MGEAEAILARLARLGSSPPRRRESIGWQRDQPIYVFRREATAPGVGRLYLSAGIHGDEPAGPLALLGLMEEGFDFSGAGVWVFPALAPDALRAGSRTNVWGVDLNRDYREPKTDEVRAHIAALAGTGEFGMALCLHEDWEAVGSYIYELNRSGRAGVTEALLDAMADHVPVDPRGEIDGWQAGSGIIRPTIRAGERPDWPEALYLYERHCPLVCTCETPSGIEIGRRAAAHMAAVRRACELLRDGGLTGGVAANTGGIRWQ